MRAKSTRSIRRECLRLSCTAQAACGGLFENHDEVEKAYFQKTRIFPIMHTVVIRRDVYQKHPWVAQSLYKAFVSAQRETYQGSRMKPPLSSTCCPGCSITWRKHAQHHGRRFLALWISSPMSTPLKPFCAIRTSRVSRSGGSNLASFSRPKLSNRSRSSQKCPAYFKRRIAAPLVASRNAAIST